MIFVNFSCVLLCNSIFHQNDVCKINDECQEHGFVNPTNTLEVCNVTLSKFQWSRLNGKSSDMHTEFYKL